MAGGGTAVVALRLLRLGVDLCIDCERDKMDDPPFAHMTDVNLDVRERAGECDGGGQGGSMMMTGWWPLRNELSRRWHPRRDKETIWCAQEGGLSEKPPTQRMRWGRP